jgi:hypothetical protein
MNKEGLTFMGPCIVRILQYIYIYIFPDINKLCNVASRWIYIGIGQKKSVLSVVLENTTICQTARLKCMSVGAYNNARAQFKRKGNKKNP